VEGGRRHDMKKKKKKKPSLHSQVGQN
jgi:hypothetical protein